MVVPDEKRAREVAVFRQQKFREAQLAKQGTPKLEDLMQRMGEEKSGQQVLNLIVKADVQGSVEALAHALSELSTSEIRARVISSGVGGIRETDVNLAIASQAVVIGFNVRADLEARKLIETSGVNVHYHNIIYDVINQVKRIMSGYLAPDIQEKVLGVAAVREVFRSSKTGAVAGCMVLEGIIKRNQLARVLRDSVVVHEGALESLRRFKDDVGEVRNGLECGIVLRDYNDIKAGDQIEVFERIEIKRELA
jgi:translation initiation factor IF-2